MIAEIISVGTEILMGQNLYADGDLFGKQEDAFGPDSFDAGTDE